MVTPVYESSYRRTEHVQAARGKAASANWETLKLDDAYFVDHLKNQAKKAKVGDSSYSLPSLPFGMDSLTLSGGSGSKAYRRLRAPCPRLGGLLTHQDAARIAQGLLLTSSPMAKSQKKPGGLRPIIAIAMAHPRRAAFGALPLASVSAPSLAQSSQHLGG